jgi:hypothetical protein
MEKVMTSQFKRIALAAGIAALVSLTIGPAPADAKPGSGSMGAVIAACDRTPGCGYSSHCVSGGACLTTGCAAGAEGSCFSCNSKTQKCTGVTPDVVRKPPGRTSAGTASSARGATSTRKLPVANVNQPVALQHSGGHSGGTKH